MKNAIGIFDSGVGGLTVLRQIRQKLPEENLIYFADTARIPYGGKSRETILRYSIENAIFLLEKDVKLLVVACNTATAHAIERLQQIFSIPVIGVIEPGVECALKTSKTGRLAVLGTKGTIDSQAYQREILRRNPQAHIAAVPCPLFVHLVEEGYAEHAATRLIIREYLEPLKEQHIDTVLLGCTHYPLLQRQIQEEMGPHITLIDSATTCAEQVAKLLTAQGMRSSVRGGDRFYVTDDPHKFSKLAGDLLGESLSSVERVSIG